MFVDECEITVSSGRGGNGVVSFRREKFVPRGGPDGGDGGRGGDVWLRVSTHLRTLSHLRHTPTFRAGAGEPGGGKKMSGAGGADAIVEVPPGTIVLDATTGELIADAVEVGAVVRLAPGGRGGRGNWHFATPVRRTPRIAEKGAPETERHLRLTLKLLADVGLVGLPNAGKSTLLARVSGARPKIADYPFTTLRPVLGIVSVGERGHLVLADLPGLIEGAHEGKGLGTQFLRHIERTRLLLILIEATDPEPEATLAVLQRELSLWSAELGARESLVCLTKSDLLPESERGAEHRIAGRPAHCISAQTGEGIDRLLYDLDRRVSRIVESERAAAAAPLTPTGPGPDFGPRPWPTRWVVPSRAGVCLPEGLQREVHRERAG
jgi:GTPase